MALKRAYFSAIANSDYSIGSIPLDPERTSKRTVTYGTGAGQGDVLYVGTGTATTSGTTLNIRDGSLKQFDQSNAVFVKLTDVYIEKDENETDAGYLIIGGGSNAVPFAGYAEPHFTFSCDSGITITASSNDNLKITSSAGTLTFNILIVGRSA